MPIETNKKKDEFSLVFFCFGKLLSQGLKFSPSLLEVLILVITGGSWREQADIARLGVGGDVGEGFFHSSVII